MGGVMRGVDGGGGAHEAAGPLGAVQGILPKLPRRSWSAGCGSIHTTTLHAPNFTAAHQGPRRHGSAVNSSSSATAHSLGRRAASPHPLAAGGPPATAHPLGCWCSLLSLPPASSSTQAALRATPPPGQGLVKHPSSDTSPLPPGAAGAPPAAATKPLPPRALFPLELGSSYSRNERRSGSGLGHGGALLHGCLTQSASVPSAKLFCLTTFPEHNQHAAWRSRRPWP